MMFSWVLSSAGIVEVYDPVGSGWIEELRVERLGPRGMDSSGASRAAGVLSSLEGRNSYVAMTSSGC